MSYLTFNRIRNNSNILKKSFSLNESTKLFTTKTPVFLSHWHDDKEFVKDVIGFLAQFGQTVYIDWLDNNMPRTTSATTASLLKQKIRVSKKFIVLATPNSIESIWIPWELGIADGTKGLSNIAILPVVQYSGTWPEREYYGIYNVIEESDTGQWNVVSPDGSSRLLGTWLDA